MRADFDRYDGMIHIVADRRRGLWANSTLMRGQRTVRTAGRTPTTEASRQTLQSIALTNALTMPKREREKLVATASTKIIKPRLLVVSDDPDFVEALKVGILASNFKPEVKPVRAGQQFKRQLHHMAAKFNLTAKKDDDEFGDCFKLTSWMGNMLREASDIQFLPPIFARSAISQIQG